MPLTVADLLLSRAHSIRDTQCPPDFARSQGIHTGGFCTHPWDLRARRDAVSDTPETPVGATSLALKAMVAIPRLLNWSPGRLPGRLPVGVLMPMMAGIGASGASLGRLMVAVMVKVLVPSPTVILIVLPSRVALNVLGLPGFAPAT